MCGRFSFVTTLKKIEKDLGVHLESPTKLLESYNVAPTQLGYVITDKDPNLLQSFHWGLIPSWSKAPKLSGQLINARKETILTKPSFKAAVKKRKCWVIVDSFYEWQHTAGGKQPYRIQRTEGKIMCLAGIWESCEINGQTVNTFAILTQEANEQMSSIHHRMPLFLNDKVDRENWFRGLSEESLTTFLQQDFSSLLTIIPVSPSVNSVRNNGTHLHDAYVPPPTLF